MGSTSWNLALPHTFRGKAGEQPLSQVIVLGAAVEAAFYKHLQARCSQESSGFSYWREKRDLKVDLIAESPEGLVPFEVKYRQSPAAGEAIKGLRQLSRKRRVRKSFIVTCQPTDFGLFSLSEETEGLMIPAPLACFWLCKP